MPQSSTAVRVLREQIETARRTHSESIVEPWLTYMEESIRARRALNRVRAEYERAKEEADTAYKAAVGLAWHDYKLTDGADPRLRLQNVLDPKARRGK